RRDKCPAVGRMCDADAADVMSQVRRVGVMVRAAVLLLAVALCRAASLDSELGVGKSINIFMR
ncbi:jg10302, partial [Pararge aegeria aegeria]